MLIKLLRIKKKLNTYLKGITYIFFAMNLKFVHNFFNKLYQNIKIFNNLILYLYVYLITFENYYKRQKHLKKFRNKYL